MVIQALKCKSKQIFFSGIRNSMTFPWFFPGNGIPWFFHIREIFFTFSMTSLISPWWWAPWVSLGLNELNIALLENINGQKWQMLSSSLLLSLLYIWVNALGRCYLSLLRLYQWFVAFAIVRGNMIATSQYSQSFILPVSKYVIRVSILLVSYIAASCCYMFNTIHSRIYISIAEQDV